MQAFDIHPFGFFLAVSFGFSAKIYSFEHSALNLLYTYNAHTIKKIHYSPAGNDLIIMSQKYIKILDSYTFAVKYILSEKAASCSFNTLVFSSLGTRLYCVYDNVFVNVHQTGSYEK